MVAVVTDIKSFYPSVSSDLIQSLLRERLVSATSNLHGWSEQICAFYQDLMRASGQGIPIGPASAHVLGNLALTEVDSSLQFKYGRNYFRYVDDIVVVTHRNNSREVEKNIAECLRTHGFSPNEDKTVILDAQTWNRSVTRSDVASEDSFRSFTSDLTIYLAFHPEQSENLRKLFLSNGIPIPLDRLLATSRYSRFRYFFRRRKSQEGLGHAFRIWMLDNQEFLVRAINLKHDYEKGLTRLLDEPIENDASLRRWQVQRIRRVVNVLFYLREFNEWNKKQDQLSLVPELVEQIALAQSLSTGDVSHVLPFFGRGASALSELWAEYGQGQQHFQWPSSGVSIAELDSLTTLKFKGSIDINLGPVNESAQQFRLLRVALGKNHLGREQPDLSYEDELHSLRLSTSNENIAQLARTRYSYTENTALDALSLMSSEYRS